MSCIKREPFGDNEQEEINYYNECIVNKEMAEITEKYANKFLREIGINKDLWELSQKIADMAPHNYRLVFVPNENIWLLAHGKILQDFFLGDQYLEIHEQAKKYIFDGRDVKKLKTASSVT